MEPSEFVKEKEGKRCFARNNYNERIMLRILQTGGCVDQAFSVFVSCDMSIRPAFGHRRSEVQKMLY